MLLPLQGFLEAVSQHPSMGYFFFHFHKNPNTVPSNFDTFQAKKSELPGKQTNKKSIFSSAHFIRFPSSSFGFFVGCSFTRVPEPILSSKSMLCYITCLGHILRDTMKTNSGERKGDRKDIVIVLLCHRVYLIVIKKLEPDPGCVCASPLHSLLNIVINPQNRFRVN